MLPPTSILAAVDFSDGSRAALALAARLAVHCGARLHVLHAQEPLLEAAGQQRGLDVEAETRDELRRFIAESWPTSVASPHLHAASGPAAEVIVDVARRERADMIVVGSRGMSTVERLVFGSTAEQVLRRVDVSVLVVPPDWTVDGRTPDLVGVGPLIVGIDLLPPSVRAAAAAGWLAASLHTWLEVVHVVPSPTVLQRWQGEVEDALQQRTQMARNELARIVRGLVGTVPVETRVETGDVAERLAAAAAVDPQRRPIVVLGRRESGRRGAAPGPNAYRVLLRSAAPVLIYLPSADR